VNQARHNMLVDLARFPTALNLRRILRSQADMSHEAARHAASAAPELVERFLDARTPAPQQGAGVQNRVHIDHGELGRVSPPLAGRCEGEGAQRRAVSNSRREGPSGKAPSRDTDG